MGHLPERGDHRGNGAVLPKPREKLLFIGHGCLEIQLGWAWQILARSDASVNKAGQFELI